MAWTLRDNIQVEAEAEHGDDVEAGHRVKGLPEYSMAEVNKHDNEKTRVWITYKNGVYDITDFIPKHPGAKNIEMAAGGSVEPFWELYAVHKNNKQVYRMLEEYRIGNLSESDVKENKANIDKNDPYGNEPKRHPALKPSSEKPFNAEPPTSILADNFFTPNDLFYVRSHLPTPEIEASEYELEITGVGVKDKTLTLNDIKKFKKYTVTSAIQCGGNRRSEMFQVKELKGLHWGAAAIGNASWSGARLYDVLRAAGLSEEETKAAHIQFEGYDLGADSSPYGASIPIEKGFDPRGDVLLAYEMNGKPLPRDHGYPIRVVVPGVVGARNVKWLKTIIVSDVESDSHWQQNDYKGFNPSVDWNNVDFTKSPAIQNMPVTSAVCDPEPGSKIKGGRKMKVKGYAWSGGGNRIIRVDLTTDQGKTWMEAKLLEQDKAKEPRHYGWTLWEAEVEVPRMARNFEIWSKAVDSSYNVQPESFENIWNLRGLLSNAYYRAKYAISW